MSSENSNFYLGKSHLIIASVFLFFVINFASSFLYSRYDIASQTIATAGIFYLIKNLLVGSVTWFLIGQLLKDKKNALISLAISVVLSGAFGFYGGTLIRYDTENLLLKSFLYTLPFYVFGVLHLKKPFMSLILAFMAIVPLANLSLGHRFISNLSFLSFSDLLKVNFSDLKMNMTGTTPGFLLSLNFDLLIVVVNTFLFFVSLILFFELYRVLHAKNLSVLFRTNFNIKNAYPGIYSFFAFIAIKTLIYYLIASITVIILGINNLPLLQNKIAQLLYLSGSVMLLVFCVVYFRKFLSEQVIPNKTFPFLIYILSLLPVIDYIAWVALLFASKPNAMQNFRAQNKMLYTFRITAVSLFSALQVAVLLYTYVFFFKKLPLADDEVIRAVSVQLLIIPVVNLALLIGSAFSLMISRIYFAFQIVCLVYIGLMVIPQTEKVLSIEFLSFDITKTLVFIVLSFCLIPVVHVRKFYK